MLIKKMLQQFVKYSAAFKFVSGYVTVFTIRPLDNTQKKKHFTTKIDPDAPVEIENPFAKERIQCILCKHNITPDYKNVQLLSQFQSPYTGRVYGKHITGLCKTQQEQIETEIVKAQNAGLMATYHKAVHFMNDPRLFDPEKPIRLHKY
ncbi:28S ribosomal protein S18c, mitochondrial [Wyeomyia smithii]|uniref:28S ribosomal protein S18c, mitochondrial n=1 Tax=Wyeomyia smithii TaxID=174621 RepID=UPI002467F583|nr:28S ribosomal protein S18c, mitochondrial [Wyeomyia smithii]